MEPVCKHCGNSLVDPFTFCPRCGKQVPQQVMPPHETPAPEPAPDKGAFTGLYFGLIAVPLLLIVGTMLCCTGLGAILGIPMIIAAVLAPLAGPLFGMGAAKGKFL